MLGFRETVVTNKVGLEISKNSL